MPDKRLRIDVPGAAPISAVTTPAKSARWTLIYAPGAGSNIDDPFGKHLADTLPADGIQVVRFQFPYMEARKSGPDRPPVLEATWRAVIESVRDAKTKLAVGGRSMGGRIASIVVAEGVRVDALALFAYPLHLPGKPEKARVEHLSSIKPPTLFCSGTNDTFGSPDELRDAAKQVRRSKLHLLEGADHGFAVRKSTGRTRDDVYGEAAATFVAWLAKIA